MGDSASGTAAVAALSWLESLGSLAQPGESSPRHEALAMLVHALLLRHGFRPEGVEEAAGRTDGEDAQRAAAEPTKRLPASWSEGGYGGRYRHHRSAMTFEVRSVPVGSKLLVSGVSLEDEGRMHSLELKVDDMVAKDVIPDSEEKQDSAPASKWDGVFKDVAAVATLVQINIAHKLVPESTKDGYQDAPPADAAPAQTTYQQPRPPHPYPLADYDHDDPLRIGPPRRPQPIDPMSGGLDPAFPPAFPSIGRGDLIHGGLPNLGRMPGGPPGFADGNLLGPRNWHPGRPSGPGLGRGGRLPPGVPPGARFDPYGPPMPGQVPGVPDRNDMTSSGRTPHPDIEPPGPPPPDMYM